MANDYDKYIDKNPGLKKAWELIDAVNNNRDLSGFKDHGGMSPAEQAAYWASRMGGTTKADFGQAHAEETAALVSGAYQEEHGSGSTEIEAGNDTPFAQDARADFVRGDIATNIKEKCGSKYCASDENCVNGKCVKTSQCSKNSDCGSGKKCVNGQCVDDGGGSEEDCKGKGRWYKGKCYTSCEDTHGEEYEGTYPNCVKKGTRGTSATVPGGDPSFDLIDPESLMSAVVTEGMESELVESRITAMLGNLEMHPMFQNAMANVQRMEEQAGRGMYSNSKGIVIQAMFDLVKQIAAADAATFNANRLNNVGIKADLAKINNTAYFNDMNTRLQGAVNEALAHIQGGYALEAQELRNIASKYASDLTHEIGMATVRNNAIKIIASIEDNAEAAEWLYQNLFIGNISPAEWSKLWGAIWGDKDDEDEDEDEDEDDGNEDTLTTNQKIKAKIDAKDCDAAGTIARSGGRAGAIYYNSIRGDCPEIDPNNLYPEDD